MSDAGENLAEVLRDHEDRIELLEKLYANEIQRKIDARECFGCGEKMRQVAGQSYQCFESDCVFHQRGVAVSVG